jgi:hypothetical protein
MDATTKASILHGMIRRMGAGGADITTEDGWTSSRHKTTAIRPDLKLANGCLISPSLISTVRFSR